jgi:hypothetical protein
MYNSQRSLSNSSFATHPLSEDPPGHVQQSALSLYLLFCDSPFIIGSSKSCTTVSALFLSPLLRLTLYQRILQVMYNRQRTLELLMNKFSNCLRGQQADIAHFPAHITQQVYHKHANLSPLKKEQDNSASKKVNIFLSIQRALQDKVALYIK